MAHGHGSLSANLLWRCHHPSSTCLLHPPLRTSALNSECAQTTQQGGSLHLGKRTTLCDSPMKDPSFPRCLQIHVLLSLSQNNHGSGNVNGLLFNKNKHICHGGHTHWRCNGATLGGKGRRSVPQGGPYTPETGGRLQSVFTFQARSPQFSTDSLREL